MRAKRAFIFVICALGALACHAQRAIEGRVEAVGIEMTTSPAPVRPGVLLEREVLDRPNLRSFRLHFTQISGRVPADAKLVIRNRSDEIVEEVSAAEFAARGDYWTKTIQGSYALVQVVGAPHAGAEPLAFKLGEIGLEAKGAVILSQVDPFNPKDRPIAEFSGNAAIMKAAKSVARLELASDGLTYTCTGFMVSPDVMLTNQHCIARESECASANVQFGYEEDAAGQLKKPDEFRCAKLLDSDAGLDFAAIRLNGRPGEAGRWGSLQLADQPQVLGQPLVLIQHPDGKAKRAARIGCSITVLAAVGRAPPELTDFGHQCDTMTGSSGSPALDAASMKVVGLHHLPYDINDTDWAHHNRAVKAERLRARVAAVIGGNR